MSKSLSLEALDDLRQGKGNFGDAILAGREGYKVARIGWNGNKRPPTVSEFIIPEFEGKVFFDEEQNLGFVKTSKDSIACVSDIDFYILENQNNWVEDEKQGLFYTDYTTDKKTVILHCLIMGNPPEGMMIDHISGNRLDNRRCNLRIATSSQNASNSKSRIGSTSKFKGVSFDSSRNKWISSIQINGKTNHIGRFNSEEECAKAYDLASYKHYGEFSRLNFPDGVLPLRMFAYIVPANSYPAQTGIAKEYWGENTLVPYREYWALKTAQEDVATWSPSGSDSLANDWCTVE